MKQKRLTAIALVSGVLCAVSVGLFMVNVQAQSDAQRAKELARFGGDQVEVCVATRDIAAGERLDYGSVEKKLWIAGLLPDSAVSEVDKAIGEIVTTPIVRGEVITSKRFEAIHNALDVPAGLQAVSVPAKAVQAVGGSVSSGMLVNIYASGDSATSLLASNVIVLASSMSQSGTSSANESGFVTLAIEPSKTQEIIAASNKTSLYLVLPGEGTSDGA